ncbi:hypothetical protein [Flavobacterium sp.]|uniref:hypothetical protein n=1 Tax=Flavobacterium sp. TaxID=239 RepID=UPI003266EB79
MKTVKQKLDITQEQYESMIWNFYSNWCESVTLTPKEFQQVVANSAINAWFRMELTNSETEFHKLTDCYTNENVTPKDFERCYQKCATTIFNYRPMSLLKQIKKSKAPQNIKVFTLN